MRSTNPILLVEDDNVDVMTVKRALKDLNIKNQLVSTANGEEALEQRRQKTVYHPPGFEYAKDERHRISTNRKSRRYPEKDTCSSPDYIQPAAGYYRKL